MLMPYIAIYFTCYATVCVFRFVFLHIIILSLSGFWFRAAATESDICCVIFIFYLFLLHMFCILCLYIWQPYIPYTTSGYFLYLVYGYIFSFFNFVAKGWFFTTFCVIFKKMLADHYVISYVIYNYVYIV